jgi:hypothetical protein
LNHISVISLFDAYIEIDVYIEGGRNLRNLLYLQSVCTDPLFSLLKVFFGSLQFCRHRPLRRNDERQISSPSAAKHVVAPDL